MSKIKSFHQRESLRFMKICLSCFGIAGTTVLASGVLKMGLLNNDRKIDQALRVLSPVAETLQQLVERVIY